MVKTIAKAVGLISVLGLVACASASDGSGNDPEQVGTDSEQLPCTDCGGGGGGYEPYYPYDGVCTTGENHWNSAGDCAADSPCVRGSVSYCYGSPSATIGRCSSLSGCGTTTNNSSTNPCYNLWSGAACLTSGAYSGHCAYNTFGQLACFAQ